jgi:uncharacterized protein YijF (DUF1287 family)
MLFVVLTCIGTVPVVLDWKYVEADRTTQRSEQVPQHYYDREFSTDLVEAVLERTKHSVTYDGSYRKITYPGGDVPDYIGVCTDVIIRAYRQVGIDLQKEIHEDMTENFNFYPNKWRLKKPDTNIDHRRVPNLRVFIERYGVELPVSRNPEHYLPGDLVTWTVQGSLPHIGIVSSSRTLLGHRPLMVHNIGRGPVLEDMLFKYPITGHYRYYGRDS